MTATTTEPAGHPIGEGGEHPYQSLYRRYRPQRFADVRGQDHVTRALRHAVRDGRVAHAYLFSGPRGTGKTSTARILAKALNCTQVVDGEPCGTCESCVAIVSGTSFDVHEIDAASNSRVEEMRDLVARASLATPGRSKVYIVDEVHMLSTGASNALLKTLEEPPEHVIFVLATTDPQKVLPTIRSRTQHFEFHLLGEDVLESLLEDVANDAGLALPEGGLGVALRRARGSARDALSVLDQVAASGTTDDDTDELAAIVASIAQRDTRAGLLALEATLHNGRDPQLVAVDLVERLRSGFLGLVAPGTTSGGVPVAKGEAEALGLARTVRVMELIGGAIVAMRNAPEPRITLEVALVRCTHPETDDSVESLLDRLAGCERRIEQLEAALASPSAHALAPAPPAAIPSPASAGPAAGAAPLGAPDDATPPRGRGPSRPVLGAYLAPKAAAPAAAPPPLAPEPPVDPPATEPAPPGVAPERDALVAAWGDHVLIGLRPKVRAYFQAGRFVGREAGDAIFALPNAVHVAQAEPMRHEVVGALSAHFGRPVGLRLVVDSAYVAPTDAEPRAPAAPVGRSPRREPEPSIGPFDSPEEGGAAAPERGATSGDPAQDESPVAPDRSGSGWAAAPSRPVDGPDTPGDEELLDLDESFEDATAASDTGVSWAEDRLLRAFPGAEEV